MSLASARAALHDLQRAPRLMALAAGLVLLAGFGLGEVAAAPLGSPTQLAQRLVVTTLAVLLLDLARALVLITVSRGVPTLGAAVRLVLRIITLSVLELVPLMTLGAAALLGCERLWLDGETRRGVFALLLAPPLAIAALVFATGRVALVLLARTASPFVAFATACALVLARPGALLRLFATWLVTTLPAWALATALLRSGARGIAGVVAGLAVAWLYARLARCVADEPGLALATV